MQPFQTIYEHKQWEESTKPHGSYGFLIGSLHMVTDTDSIGNQYTARVPTYHKLTNDYYGG